MNFNHVENFSDLDNFIPNPKDHVSAFIDTFTMSIDNNGPDSFAPMLSFFDSSGNLTIGVQLSSYEDKQTMYKNIAEIMQLYPALNSSACIFASDVRLTTYNSNSQNSKTQPATEALSLTFVNTELSAVLTMPYQIHDRKVVWQEQDFAISNFAEDDPSKVYQGDMIELFFIMTHLEGGLFSVPEILNYLSYKGVNYILSDTSDIDKIEIKL